MYPRITGHIKPFGMPINENFFLAIPTAHSNHPNPFLGYRLLLSSPMQLTLAFPNSQSKLCNDILMTPSKFPIMLKVRSRQQLMDVLPSTIPMFGNSNRIKVLLEVR